MDRVYVGNLPPDIRIKDIDDFFRPFGKLVYIDVNNRANPVYALVQFDSVRNAFNAVKARHGYDYEGYTLQLRLVESEVRKRDITPPPPQLSMFNYGAQSNRSGDFNLNEFSNSRFNNSSMSSFQPSTSSQWNNNIPQQPQRQNTLQFYGNNRDNAIHQNMMEYPKNMQQQNIFPSNVQSNIQQQYSTSFRSNISQQQQPTNNSNRSNMSQQFSNSNMSQQSINYSSHSDMLQQQRNINYSNTNRSNMPLQQNRNIMDYSNNGSWNSDTNNVGNMGWNCGNNTVSDGRNNYNNAAPYKVYNADNDPYAKVGFEDSFTRGLSGSGRKWFNRYIRKGFSPEMARNKALEHRTVPYLRDHLKMKAPIPNDQANVALETIGNTIISLLSTNSVDNLNNWGGDNFQGGFNNGEVNNFDLAGPSTSRGLGKRINQSPAIGPQRNRVSKQQYLKSLDILNKLRRKRVQTVEDKISKKYHTQIVKDYEQFEKAAATKLRGASSKNSRNDRQIATKPVDEKAIMELSVAFKKKKQQLFLAARRFRNANPNQRFKGEYRRTRILTDKHGFEELEAKALAVHPIEKLQSLISMKEELDKISKNKPDPLKPIRKPGRKSRNETAYRKDINYIKLFENRNLENLSSRVKSSLRACLTRVHKHEKEAKIPLTKTKFTKLLPNKAFKNTQTDNKKGQQKNIVKTNKPLVKNKGNTATNANKKIEEKIGEVNKTNENKNAVAGAEIEGENEVEEEEVVEVVDDTEEQLNAEDNEEEDGNDEQDEANGEEYKDAENPEYDEEDEENNE